MAWAGRPMRKTPEGRGRGGQRRLVEAPAEEQVNDLFAGHDADRCDEGHDPQQQPQRARDHGAELGLVALGQGTRHRGQQHDAQRQADDAEGDLDHAEGDGVAHHRADRDGARERGVDQEGDLVGAHADGSRQHQPERLPRGRIVYDPRAASR